jgi:hypothetical protein
LVEPEPVGATVDPLGDVPGPTVLPDGFIELLAPLFTAPEVPAPVVPDPLVPVLPELVLAEPAADVPAAPLPVPPACANARDDVRTNAPANATVASFMSMSPC